MLLMTVELAWPAPPVSASAFPPQEEEIPPGLQVRLSEVPGPQPASRHSEKPKPLVTQWLSETQAGLIFKRLPGLHLISTDVVPFRLPPKTLPLPKPDDTLTRVFPSPESGATPGPPRSTGPLRVMRYQPEGPIDEAKPIRVTFSHPMLVAQSRQDFDQTPVPVHISPPIEGQWQWISPVTAVFTPVQLPKATQFVVTVPAGTQSATGNELKDATQWRFSTSGPHIEWHFVGVQDDVLRPLVAIRFDQKINPDEVAPFLRLTVQGENFPIQKVNFAELEADEKSQKWVLDYPDDYFVFFRPAQSLPRNVVVTVTVLANLPSAEGPLTTLINQSFEFDTYPLLRMVGDERTESSLHETMVLGFNNQLDFKTFRPEMVTISPPIPSAQITVRWNEILIYGKKPYVPVYTVTVSGDLTDQSGQRLEQPVSRQFKIRLARPDIHFDSGVITTFDPGGLHQLNVYSQNIQTLNVRLYRVTADDWNAYASPKVYGWAKTNEVTKAILREPVFSQSIPVKVDLDEVIQGQIDLAPALPNGTGQVLVEVSGVVAPGDFDIHTVRAFHWVQSSRLAVDVVAGGSELLVWANSLSDGKPVSGATVTAYPGGETTTVDADGLGRLPFQSNLREYNRLVVRKGEDSAILCQTYERWYRQPPGISTIHWHLLSDRTVYQPGEDIHLKGWVRLFRTNQTETIESVGNAFHSVSYTIVDPRGVKLGEGSVPVNAFGGFYVKGQIPKTATTGAAWINLKADLPDTSQSFTGQDTKHPFQIQEYQRPDFEVTISNGDGPFVIGGATTATARVQYYTGGGLSEVPVDWTVRTEPARVTPPNWSAFSFNQWVPWWYECYPQPRRVRTSHHSGKTNASGEHHLNLDFLSLDQIQPFVVKTEASVQDINRREVSAHSQFLVHPASVYVGLQATNCFGNIREPQVIKAIVTDLDGTPIAGQNITFTVKLRYRYHTQRRRTQEFPAETIKSADTPVPWAFIPQESGVYQVTAQIRDAQGRLNQASDIVWAIDDTSWGPSTLNRQSVTLIPEKPVYEVGEVAEILVQSPFAPAEGLVTIQRPGMVSSSRFTMDGITHRLKIPIQSDYLPAIHVQVDLIGAVPRRGKTGRLDPQVPGRPVFASGVVACNVSLRSRTLTVQATPREAVVRPGGTTTIDVAISDHTGKPVTRSECALVVVDEAVLALTGYRLISPVESFYQDRGGYITTTAFRSHILLEAPVESSDEELTQPWDEFGDFEATEEISRYQSPRRDPFADPSLIRRTGADPIQLRTQFAPLALFADSVVTDARGRASVKVKLPDSLTRYRVMAAAVAGARFGIGESTITAQLPLTVRSSSLRFLNFGDQCEFPVLVQNQTASPLTVDVAIRANHLNFPQGTCQRVTVPARDRVEVRFPVVTTTPGTARIHIAGVAGRLSDAAEIVLPVYTPATTQAFVEQGSLDQGAIVQPLSALPAVIPEYGGVEVTTASTQLQVLTDALLYLVNYEHSCTEQLSSAILGIAALRDVSSAFQSRGLPDPKTLDFNVAESLNKLKSRQLGDGGFRLWDSGNDDFPFASIHALHAVAKAKEKQYPVPDRLIERGKAYLYSIESVFKEEYSPESRQTLQAYALYVRHLLGDSDVAQARELISQATPDQLPVEVIGWLLPIVARDKATQGEFTELLRQLNNRVTETAGEASFGADYSDREGIEVLLHSVHRTDAIVLDSLIQVKPDSLLIPKLVQGLLTHRLQGRWRNTQENVFGVLALGRYFTTFEKETPDFIARTWIGSVFAGETQYTGRTTDQHRLEVPMSWIVANQGPQTVTLSKEGTGRLYYRIGMNYAPKNLDLKPHDAGFQVSRDYQAVDDPSDVKKVSDSEWHVRAGARVRVVVTMTAPSRRYHVALVSPLAAGMEMLNPVFATTGGDVAGARGFRNSNWWFEFQNLGNDRAEAFSRLLQLGTYRYSYLTLATTPGRFIVPPAKAEEMYAPEIFGRGQTDVVVIKAQ